MTGKYYHNIMKINNLLVLVFFFSAFSLFFVSCKEQTDDLNDDGMDTDSINQPDNKEICSILTPAEGGMYSIGDSINFQFEVAPKTVIDSALLFFGAVKINSWKQGPYKYSWASKNMIAGTHSFRFFIYSGGEKIAQKTVNLKFKSDVIPQRYTYKVIREYPHSITAYTQGFCYEDGFIYEGTGQYGESKILKYKLESNELVQSSNNDGSIFGEGIAIVGDKLVQLTWQAGLGFVYDKNSFKRINKFNFQTEGWGLVYDGDQLIMSDGSHNLHYLETSVFSTTKSIEVYDNEGPVVKLNELEMIDGMIYANIYTKDIIVIIDPATGKVTGEIDFSGILKPADRNNRTDVLNGIAWDEKGNRLFITGKYWPKIYQVELIKK